MEPDTKVLKLTKVLSDMDEALSATLHPRKTKVCLLKTLTFFEINNFKFSHFSTSSKVWHIWWLEF